MNYLPSDINIEIIYGRRCDKKFFLVSPVVFL